LLRDYILYAYPSNGLLYSNSRRLWSHGRNKFCYRYYIAITLVNKNSFVKSCFYTSNIVTKSTSKIGAKICGGVNGRGVKERERWTRKMVKFMRINIKENTSYNIKINIMILIHYVHSIPKISHSIVRDSILQLLHRLYLMLSLSLSLSLSSSSSSQVTSMKDLLKNSMNQRIFGLLCHYIKCVWWSIQRRFWWRTRSLWINLGVGVVVELLFLFLLLSLFFVSLDLRLSSSSFSFSFTSSSWSSSSTIPTSSGGSINNIISWWD